MENSFFVFTLYPIFHKIKETSDRSFILFLLLSIVHSCPLASKSEDLKRCFPRSLTEPNININISLFVLSVGGDAPSGD